MTLFEGEGAEEYEALMESLKLCAKNEEQDIYQWLEETPKTSLIVFLVDNLHQLGFKIVKAEI